MTAGSGTDFDDVKVKGIGPGGVDREIGAVQSGGFWRLLVDVASDEAVDAFGRLKVSQTDTLLDLNHRFGKHPLYWDESTTGTASSTHETNRASVKMSVGTASGDKIIRQTYRYFRYFPGKSQTIVVTGNFDGTKANVRKRYGYFDDRNGIFFETNGTALRVVRRSYVSGSVVDTVYEQADWNIDKLDGTGPSGYTIDLTKAQIWHFDFQWLGSGRVRWGLNIEGSTIFFHTADAANILATPYSSSADLPLRAELENTDATASATDMYVTCFSVMSDGGNIDIGKITEIDTGTTEVTVSTTETALFATRLKSANNRSSAVPLNIDFVMTTGNSAAKYRMYVRPTISATWSSSGSDSALEESIGTNITSFSGGTELPGGYVAAGAAKTSTLGTNIQPDVFLGRSIAGTSDVLLVTVQMIGGTGKLVGGLHMREFQ